MLTPKKCRSVQNIILNVNVDPPVNSVKKTRSLNDITVSSHWVSADKIVPPGAAHQPLNKQPARELIACLVKNNLHIPDLSTVSDHDKSRYNNELINHLNNKYSPRSKITFIQGSPRALASASTLSLPISSAALTQLLINLKHQQKEGEQQNERASDSGYVLVDKWNITWQLQGHHNTTPDGEKAD